jgi:hypothetical protein
MVSGFFLPDQKRSAIQGLPANGEIKEMRIPKRLQTCLVLSVLFCLPFSTTAMALNDSGTVNAGRQTTGDVHDGGRDFDFELGSWKIHLKKLQHPLSGSNTWVEFDGTSITRKLWDGRSQLEQFETDSPTMGHIEGLTLRLYDPQSHQWSLYWVNSKDGILAQPTVGEFKSGHGEFYDQEPFNGRMIFVRFIWSNVNSDSPHFEQSFSDDGGKTWEVNWITDQTRVSEDTDKSQSDAGTAKAMEPVQGGDSQHDFDFEFGSWTAHLKRLLHPLSGSNEWVEYDGTSVVRKIWDGRANLGELEVDGPKGHIEGLTLRLYHPQSHQWSLYWANSKAPSLAVPTVGQFKDGHGEFFDQEDFDGKSILVRFIFSDITSISFHTEQAFSVDGGKTWETNWIANFTRPAK